MPERKRVLKIFFACLRRARGVLTMAQRGIYYGGSIYQGRGFLPQYYLYLDIY